MKTLEFKLYPTLAQSQTIDKWLQDIKWVWNKGLSLKFADRQKYYRTQVGDNEALLQAVRIIPDSVVLHWKWRKIETTDKKGKITEKWEKVRLVGSGIIRPKNGYPYCQIREHRNIDEPGKFKYFRNDNSPHFVIDIPSEFKEGMADTLKKAWQAYNDPKRPTQKPKFKGKNDKVRSLTSLHAGGKSKLLKPERIPGSNNGFVQFPKLGKIKVKGLFAKHDWVEWGSAKIVKEPSGYYLHVCVDIPNKPLPKSDKAVGIDPGLISIITTDQGREVKPPKLYRKQQAKLKRLQRKASRQKKGGCNQKKTYRKIALHHEKIRRSRNAFNHKLSTKTIREFSGIAIEDIPIQKLNRSPKAKKREDGNGYEHNGAQRKAGLNKSFADAALGDLINKIETKCKGTDREFVKVTPNYTTVDCSNCGAKIKKALSERTHRCTNCGFVLGRDHNAARNILLKGQPEFKTMYRAWAWEHGETRKPDSDSHEECHREAKTDLSEIAPSPEYGDPITYHPLSLTSTSDACYDSVSAILTPKNKRKDAKKRRLSESDSENHVQLTLW
ncbi:MAG: type V CRISPR-associated protein C2c8 [Dolichospermum sp.]